MLWIKLWILKSKINLFYSFKILKKYSSNRMKTTLIKNLQIYRIIQQLIVNIILVCKILLSNYIKQNYYISTSYKHRTNYFKEESYI